MFMFSVFRVPKLKLGSRKPSAGSLESSPKGSPRPRIIRKHSSLKNSPREAEPINRLEEIKKNLCHLPQKGFEVTVKDLVRGHGACVYFKGKKIFLNNSHKELDPEKLENMFDEMFARSAIGNYIKQAANQNGFLSLSETFTKAAITSRDSIWVMKPIRTRHDFIMNSDDSVTYIERIYLGYYHITESDTKISPREKPSEEIESDDSGINTSEVNRPLGIFVTKSVIKLDDKKVIHVFEKDLCYVLDDKLINPDGKDGVHKGLFDEKTVGIFIDRKNVSFKDIEHELNYDILNEVYTCELNKLKNACGELEEVSTPRTNAEEENPPAPNEMQLVGQHTVKTVKKILATEKVSIDEIGLVTDYVKSNTSVIKDPADSENRKKLLNATIKVAHIGKPWGLTLGLSGLLLFSIVASVAAAALIPASGGLTAPLAFWGLMIVAKSAACLIASTAVTVTALLTTLGMGMLTFKSREMVVGPLGESYQELTSKSPSIN